MMDKIERYGLAAMVAFLFLIMVFLTEGCAARRYVLLEADEITITAGTATFLTGIPAIDAKGLRMWIASGDRQITVPESFFHGNRNP